MFFPAITGEIIDPQIVGKYQNDVWPGFLGARRREKEQGDQRETD
jgi:hypothetical protein